MENRALFCGFKNPDGRWRLLAITKHISEEGWYALLARYSEGTSPTLNVYPSIGACDADFMGVVEDLTLDGFEFCGELERTIPPMVVNQYTEAWAESVLNAVVVEMKLRKVVS